MKTDGKLRVGDWVEVRSKRDILSTLDSNGCLDGMPFMPEMLQYCGQKYQVYKSAHKTCDYTTFYPYHVRRLEHSVHLKMRCDGAAHGGCQAGCLLYWKYAWLKRVEEGYKALSDSRESTPAGNDIGCVAAAACTELDLYERAQALENRQDGSHRYVCQATQVHYATTPLAWWDVRQYLEDYWLGNVRLGRIVDGIVYSIYYHISQAGIGLGRPLRWFYNKCFPLWGGTPFPRNQGLIPEGKKTPITTLNLQPGELVRVKSQGEILKTVDRENRNRGMYWDAELVPYCGGTYRVLRRVSRIIDEKTGNMIEMKSPCIVLDSVICQARYSPCRMLCPKEMYPYWREIWLERVNPEIVNETRPGQV